MFEIVVDLSPLYLFEIDEYDVHLLFLLNEVEDFLLIRIMIDYWMNFPTKKKI